ncbi:hypothetical protein [Nocardia sp. NPDC055050]
MMRSSMGTIVLVAAGLIIIAIGGYHVYKGATQSFLEDLQGSTSKLRISQPRSTSYAR